MRFVSKAVDEPYAIVVPYSTCESAASFVVHVIVALLDVIDDAKTDEMVGGVMSEVPPYISGGIGFPRYSQMYCVSVLVVVHHPAVLFPVLPTLVR